MRLSFGSSRCARQWPVRLSARIYLSAYLASVSCLRTAKLRVHTFEKSAGWSPNLYKIGFQYCVCSLGDVPAPSLQSELRAQVCYSDFYQRYVYTVIEIL